MLHRRQKRRYIALLTLENDGNLQERLRRRHSELFGVIAAADASIKLVKQDEEIVIVRCSLDSLKSILVTIALLEPAILALGVSGSLKGLKAQSLKRKSYIDVIIRN